MTPAHAAPRVLLLVLSEIRRDPRVLKQVALLRERYAVTTCGFGDAPDGVDDHVRLDTEARGWPNDRVGLLLRRHDSVYWGLPAVLAARDALAGREFDAVVANDLNTVPLATTVRSRGGFHADLHEYAPAEKANELGWRLLVAPYQRYLLRRYATRARSATTVSEGIAAAYREHFGIACGVVPNAAPYRDAEPTPVHDPVRVVFTGAAQAARHVDLMVEAMAHVPPGRLELDLYLMPNEPEYLRRLEERARQVPGVRVLPPVAFPELMGTVASYDVALAFQRPTTFNIEHALPNKFFEAIQARTAVVVGPAPEVATITRRHGIGVVTDDFTAAALGRALADLTPERVAALKQATHAAAWELSAERTTQPWLDAVEGMVAAARGQGAAGG